MAALANSLARDLYGGMAEDSAVARLELTRFSSHAMWRLVCVVLLAFMGMPQSVSARQATPESTATVGCDVAQRAVDEILALLKPPPGEGTPWPWYEILPLPEGKPVAEEITAEIAATLREMEACINAGIDLRYFSFFSDAWIGRITASHELETEFRSMAVATPKPIPSGQQIKFPGPWHVEVLPDGRVLAAVLWFIDEDAPCLDMSRTKALVFLCQDGRWIIDQVIENVNDFDDVIDEVGPPPEALLAELPAQCEEMAVPSTRERPLNALAGQWRSR
jgi:hypothetical protein